MQTFQSQLEGADGVKNEGAFGAEWPRGKELKDDKMMKCGAFRAEIFKSDTVLISYKAELRGIIFNLYHSYTFSQGRERTRHPLLCSLLAKY